MNDQKTKTKSILKTTLISLGAGAISFIILTLLCALFFYIFKINERIIPHIFCGILFISSFVLGVVSSKNAESKGYLRGLLGGLAFIALMFIVFKIVNRPVVMKSYITFMIMVVLSVIGGIAGIN